MRGAAAIATAVAAAALFASSVFADVDPIIIEGTKFFYKTNGTQFFIRGVAYQQDYGGNGTTASTGGENTYIDPLSDPSNCQRDIPYLLQLETNTIRVYAIDPTQNHDECMGMFADAGIYVIADLAAPGASIDRSDPTWDTTLYARYTSVIDAMQGYNNVLGFFAGNEVSNNQTNTDASAYVKAAVRDSKAYIKSKGYRTIGVGYAADDDASIRDGIADYFNCGDPADAIDFFGLNIYEWCGDSSYTLSGYSQRTADFANYSVPAFFAEYGCNTDGTRIFTEVGALFGPEMTPVWSGGIVYMYFQETNDFGLVTVSGDSVSKLPDFTNLQSQMAMATPSSTNLASYTPTNTVARSCPTVGADWNAASNLPPTPNSALCACMYSALSCKPDSSVTNDTIGALFGTVCGLSAEACDGIASDASTGDFGTYEMCAPEQQLGWALNAYYGIQYSAGNAASACDFGGSATLVSAASPTGSCVSLLAVGTAAGTGSSSTGGSGSGSSSSSKGAGVGAVATVASLNLGFAQFAVYLVCAVGSGIAMVVL